MNTLYRILTYILLLFGALMGVSALSGLLLALGNPGLLLPLFIIVSTVIYIFTSFTFMQRGIIGGNRLKPQLYHWIRVNAFVATVFAVLMLAQSFVLRANPQLTNEALDQFVQSQNLPYSREQLGVMMQTMFGTMLIAGIVLLVHLILTFYLLPRHRALFNAE